RAWSEALDKHDVDALAPLYAPRVKLYTGDLPRAAVLGAKKRALGPGSTFRQQITSEIDVESSAGAFSVSFTKRSGPAGKLSDVRATLVIAGEPLAITEERDAASDARASTDVDDRCGGAALKVAVSLPAVKKLIADVEAELPKHPERRMGGIGPMREEDGQLTGGLGVHSDERYEALVWYAVSADGTKLDVSAPTASADPLRVPPADAARVAAACRRSSR
ncbi:MAG: hypothetical protein JWP87_538, partial [Labilithrix sp.]|nr:hypothetical protein [Labilithrix sp.]